MPVTEEKRHHLYRRLEEVLGAEEATTMMELVPPVGWADVATRQDLENLNLSIRADLHRELRVQLVAIVGLNLSMLAGAVTLIRF